MGSTRCIFSVAIEANALQISDSEELDAANARDTEDAPPQSHAYEELVEVVTRAVEKLSIDWWRSWERPVSYRVYSTQTSHYSSILNKKEHGYKEMPKVEESLASYLSPESSSSINYPLSQ